MKKSLIAVAVASAIAAPVMAQNVTISGNLDAAAATISGTQTMSNASTVSTVLGTGTTSVINIQAVEDLGGGMRVTAKYGLDPRTLFNDSLAVTNNTSNLAGSGGMTTTASLSNTATGLARDEAFVGLSGAFGNIRLGSPNSIGLNTFQISSQLGTGIGSGYGGTGAMYQSFSAIRYNRSLRYDTPTINGFSAAVLYAPGADNAAVTAATTTGGNRVPFLTPNQRQTVEFGLRFAQGPVTVGYARVANNDITNGPGWYGSGTVAARRTAVNLVNASLALGTTTVGVGYHSGDQASNGLDTSGYHLSIKQDFGTFDVMGMYTRFDQNTSTTASLQPTVTGVRADYKLSKTSAAYVGYESWDTDTAYASTTTSGKRNIGSVGLRKVF